ncbi:hypothetical protein V2O64_06980 [Verrucomicrobiaceae bacterium 227]
MKFLALTVLSLSFISCSFQKSKLPKPSGDRTSLDAPVPDEAMAKKYQFDLDQVGLGHAIYMRKCGECHLHVLPDEVTSNNWHVIVPGMSWNAGISPAEEKALLAYLQVAAKEKPRS